MTVKISANKSSKILHHLFNGLTQPDIAEKCGVHQATVSHTFTRFKAEVNRSGMLSAAKEYGIMNEVDSLRSLAVELSNNRLIVEESKQGVKLIRLLSSLGVPVEAYPAAAKAISKIETPSFIQSAIKLIELESTTGKGYSDIVSEFESLTSEKLQLEQNIADLQKETRDLKKIKDELKVEINRGYQQIKKQENEAKKRLSATE